MGLQGRQGIFSTQNVSLRKMFREIIIVSIGHFDPRLDLKFLINNVNQLSTPRYSSGQGKNLNQKAIFSGQVYTFTISGRFSGAKRCVNCKLRVMIDIEGALRLLVQHFASTGEFTSSQGRC